MYRALPDFDTLVTLHKEQLEELERIYAELTDAILENTSGQTSSPGASLEARIIPFIQQRDRSRDH
jgi:hypothetical protein